MRKLPILIGLSAAFAVPGIAAEDPIAVRQALMQSNGAAAAVAGGVMKGELEYNPVIGRAAINAFVATAAAVGDFFPEGSADPERSAAAPRIWEDMVGFQSKLGDFQTAVGAAAEASGRDGPPDQAAFTAAVQPVLKACSSCHETYRLEE
jgi:cytochrome c556